MAHVVEFRIDKLAGRSEPYERELNQDINVFFGPNGVGKTTILRTLYSALKDDASLIANAGLAGAKVTFFSQLWNGNIVRSLKVPRKGKLLPLSESVDVFDEESYQYSRAREAARWKWETITPESSERKDEPSGFRGTYLPVSRLYTYALSNNMVYGASSQSNDAAHAEPQLESTFVMHVQKLWRDYSNRLLAEVGKVQLLGLTRILDTVLSSTSRSDSSAPKGDPESAYNLAESFLHRQRGFKNRLGTRTQFKTRYNDRPELRAVIEDIRKVETQIEQAERSKKELQSLLNDLFANDTKHLVLAESEIHALDRNGDRVSLDQLSSGEKQILKLYIECITLENGPLIIDEPEISMHIDWQRRLLRTFRLLNPGAQLVVATHSPEIMAEVDDDKIFRV